MIIITLGCGCSYRLRLSACPECMEDVGDVNHGITCISSIKEDDKEGNSHV